MCETCPNNKGGWCIPLRTCSNKYKESHCNLQIRQIDYSKRIEDYRKEVYNG